MRAGVAAGAFSLWQETPGSSWSCRDAASPSCSHWAGLPRSCCLRDAAGGNSSLQRNGEAEQCCYQSGGCLCGRVGTSLKSRQAGFTP